MSIIAYRFDHVFAYIHRIDQSRSNTPWKKSPHVFGVFIVREAKPFYESTSGGRFGSAIYRCSYDQSIGVPDPVEHGSQVILNGTNSVFFSIDFFA
jgi:hypothetical protein